jgi:regulator of cell morphogenesis and NO signaling
LSHKAKSQVGEEQMSADTSKAAKEKLEGSPSEPMRSLESDLPVESKQASLSSLMAHIVEKHHAYCRRELDVIEQLLRTAVRAHGDGHPELRRIQSLFAKLGTDLKQHLIKEEQTLFPMIARMEEAHNRNTALPKLPFGTIANPIRMMVMEHDTGDKELEEIRKLSSGFTVPPNGSETHRVLYQKLKEFNEDMQQHVHLEDRQLFPRAVSLEQASGAKSTA